MNLLRNWRPWLRRTEDCTVHLTSLDVIGGTEFPTPAVGSGVSPTVGTSLSEGKEIMSAIERVAAACSKSPFKDDRHEWVHVSGFDTIGCAKYEVRECKHCHLVILTGTSNSTYANRTPAKDEVILHAFFAEGE